MSVFFPFFFLAHEKHPIYMSCENIPSGAAPFCKGLATFPKVITRTKQCFQREAGALVLAPASKCPADTVEEDGDDIRDFCKKSACTRETYTCAPFPCTTGGALELCRSPSGVFRCQEWNSTLAPSICDVTKCRKYDEGATLVAEASYDKGTELATCACKCSSDFEQTPACTVRYFHGVKKWTRNKEE